METDPPADALVAAIGHRNEVAGLNNDGGKAEAEDLNENGGGASGEEARLPNPKPKRIYNKVGFMKRKICISRHKKGQQKQTIHDFSAIRASIGIRNDNPRILFLPLWVIKNLERATRSPQRQM